MAKTSKKAVRARIYMSGTFTDYVVHTAGFQGLPIQIRTDHAATGFAIVRVLRDIAYERGI